MTVAVFGLGYVGCVSLGCLAQNGFRMIGVDVSETKVNLINRGKPTIVEKDIDRIVASQHAAGNIRAVKDYNEAVEESDVSIICVGTPSSPTGHLNLDFVYEVAGQIGRALAQKQGFHAILIRSTVLPGTNKQVGDMIAAASGKTNNKDFAIVSNPEFLREGTAVLDYYNPPYTLIGTDSDRAAVIAEELYSKVNGDFIRAPIEAVELIKYVNNSYHALKVTFGNEVGNICKEMGVDSHEVMRLFCLDRQLNISPYYFKPGFAYGGSCLPKDLKALRMMAKDCQISSPVIEAIEASNDNHIIRATKALEEYDGRKIGILGIAFKQGTDDLRHSPVIRMIEHFYNKGYEIRLQDDFVNEAILIGANREYLHQHLPYLSGLMVRKEEELVSWADIIIINRKKDGDEQMLADHPDKRFFDLVRVSGRTSGGNYQGICW